jgi:multiple sugar transport system permease protein
MAIILETERRHPRSILLYTAVYLFLFLGAATMVYPFLMMISGSMKSRVDAHDLDLIPAYFTDMEVLYRKYLEAKYGEDLQLYLQTTGDPVRNFRAVALPKDVETSLVDDWREFVTSAHMPSSWFLTGFGPTLDGRIIQKNERAFRNFVRDQCGNDLETFHAMFQEPIENWFFLKFRQERPADRKYQVSDTPLMRSFYDFKESLPLKDRIYVSCDRIYQRYNRLRGLNPEEEGIPLEAGSTDPVWESFVRTSLHPQFIRFREGSEAYWTAHLTSTYREIAHLNRVYGTQFSSFADVPLPEDRMTASPGLTDLLALLAREDALPLDLLEVDTPEIRWRTFLKEKYGSLQQAAMSFGLLGSSVRDVPMPQRELDYETCVAHSGEIRRRFAASNFLMVFEFILFYGNGTRNTVIYCLLSIGLALLVNPLAAYALSRYTLPSQYKILLFLIATMAFPGVVTMIPNFLLLRDLGLLNTFAALLLPAMANGYSIFLLKGFFDSLPRELYEAAEIDGATEWHQFWIITMNLSKPILAVIALGAFTGAYSNFMYAFILCQDREMWTLMVWLYQLQQFSSQGVVFASLLIGAIPTLLVFVLCQNVIMKGIVVPTEK